MRSVSCWPASREAAGLVHDMVELPDNMRSVSCWPTSREATGIEHDMVELPEEWGKWDKIITKKWI